MTLIKNKYFIWIVRFFIAFIFIFAGIEKIADPASFAESIANYKIVPIYFVNFFAITLPWIELISGLLIIFGLYIRENSAIYISLMSVFTIMILVAVLRGLDIDCGCFGTADAQSVGLAKIFENIGLILLGVFVFMVSDTSTKVLNDTNT